MEGSAANTAGVFLLTPLREGRHTAAAPVNPTSCISTHAPAGGATKNKGVRILARTAFLLTPLREGRPRTIIVTLVTDRFLLTPLREGRPVYLRRATAGRRISTHAPAGGATVVLFYGVRRVDDFYSRPCGRGDGTPHFGAVLRISFLLTPLREGRLGETGGRNQQPGISTHAPAGGATEIAAVLGGVSLTFLLTPLREGRPRIRRSRSSAV